MLVLPHLDLLAGGGERGMTGDARGDRRAPLRVAGPPVLAFADRSRPAPRCRARFRCAPSWPGSRATSRSTPSTAPPLGVALVTEREHTMFAGYKPTSSSSRIAGVARCACVTPSPTPSDSGRRGSTPEAPARVERLYEFIRVFKAQTSEQFVIPDVTMKDIGGYEQVKASLERALGLMSGAWTLPDDAIRRELIPRGFLLYGPPGTGKTLFAKAIANRLNATIRVVSGPEVTDMYVGESERKLRARVRRGAERAVGGRVRRVRLHRGAADRPRRRRQPRRQRAGGADAHRDGRLPPRRAHAGDRHHQPARRSSTRPCCARAASSPSPSACPTTRRGGIARVHARHFHVEVPERSARGDRRGDPRHERRPDPLAVPRRLRGGTPGETRARRPTPEWLGFWSASSGRGGRRANGLRRRGAAPGAAPQASAAALAGPRRRASSPMFIVRLPSAEAAGGTLRGDVVLSWPEPTRKMIQRLARVRTEPAGRFYRRDDAVDVLALGAICREHVLLLGPPGTGKTDLVMRFVRLQIERRASATCHPLHQPAELFGPLDLPAFQEGRYHVRTEGMLPRASIAFLDEVFQGGSADPQHAADAGPRAGVLQRRRRRSRCR